MPPGLADPRLAVLEFQLMPDLQTRIYDSLDSLSEERLKRVAGEGLTFATPDWLRLVERIDLAAMTGGSVELKFAVVTADGVPVSVCPLLRARGSELLVNYNFRRYYFEYWIEEAKRLNGTSTKEFERTVRFATRYLRVLDRFRCSTDDFLIACSPLSFRTHVPVSPDSPVPRSGVCRELVSALKKHAEQLDRPLSFLWVEEEDELAEALDHGEFERAFAFYDNYVCLQNVHDFDDYLQTFRSSTRWQHRKEIRQIAKSGVDYASMNRFDGQSETFSRLYEQTYSRHGSSFFRQPPGFWTSLHEQLGRSAEALIATQQDRTIGFSMLLNNDRQREMWLYRIGREYEGLEDAPFYFGLAYYEPIRRAIEAGCQRLWLGPGGYDTKLRRGAVQLPLYHWYWFPRQRDRLLLSPYVRGFGKIARKRIAAQTNQTLRIGTRRPLTTHVPRPAVVKAFRAVARRP